MGINMGLANKNFKFFLITVVLVAIGLIYLVFVKGYWFYGSYTWEHSNIKRYTEADYKKSEEFLRLFQMSEEDSKNPEKIKEQQEKLVKLINSGLEVNCPVRGYNIESAETEYADLPLEVACSYGNYEIAQLLIEKGAVVGRIKGLPSPLGSILDFYDDSDLEMVKFLLENGAEENVDAEGTNYTNRASSLATPGGVRLSNKDDAHNATLIFKELEATGAELNQKQVVLAAGSNNAELLKYLIEEKGMDLNQGLEFPQYFTPLTAACYDNSLDTAKYLLEHGANKNLINTEGKKAIDYAHTEEMKALLKKNN